MPNYNLTKTKRKGVNNHCNYVLPNQVYLTTGKLEPTYIHIYVHTAKKGRTKLRIRVQNRIVTKIIKPKAQVLHQMTNIIIFEPYDYAINVNCIILIFNSDDS